MNDDTKKLSEKAPQPVINSVKRAKEKYVNEDYMQALFWMMNAQLQLSLDQMLDPTPADPAEAQGAEETPPVAESGRVGIGANGANPFQVPPQVEVVERFAKAMKSLAEARETVEDLERAYRSGRLGLISIETPLNPTDEREEMIERYHVAPTGNVYDRKHGNWVQGRLAKFLDLRTMMPKSEVYVPGPGPEITQEDLQKEYLRGLSDGKNTPVYRPKDTTSSTHSNIDYEALYREGLVKYNACAAERDALREALVEINGCGSLPIDQAWREIRKVLIQVGL